MNISLMYGKTGLDILLPDDTTVIEPQFIPGLPDEKGAIISSIRNPIKSLPLREIVKTGHKVGISVCDITRPSPTSTVLPIVLQELSQIPNLDINIFIATGTHRENSPEELYDMLGSKEILEKFKVINHRSDTSNSLDFLGTTSNGIPIYLNSEWMTCDTKITLGFVEPHFFAGFSGGPKMIAPGLAGIDTIMELHGSEMIKHPNSRWGQTIGNPIHDSIREIATNFPSDFTLDVTINKNRSITSVFAGEMFSIHQEACEFVKNTAMQKVENLFDIVITTNNGYPLDMNLYQCVKGVSAAFEITKEFGSIVCAAECSDGIPNHGLFKEILTSRKSPSQLLEMIEDPSYNKQDQWQVQIQAQIQKTTDIYLKSDYLSNDEIYQAHLIPVENIETTINNLMSKYGGNPSICVLPEGPQTIPYI
tara:strand:+ start:229 stop:1491 length:1263 start_codon:yes stop_codon:yes gene_type:complete